jgi:predicted transcriptional regulator
MTEELDLETRRELFELISNFPGLHFREILRRLNISRGLVLFLLLNPNSQFNVIVSNFDLAPSKLAYHLKKLLDKEIIEKERKGRTTVYKVVNEEAIANVLISYRPSFLDSVVENFIEAWKER